MGQQYSSRDFFRRMPNALLARYFQGKGLFEELDFGAMKQTRPDALVAAWAALPDERCDALEAELSAVHTLSDAAGWQALQDAARDMLEADAAAAFVAALAALEDHLAQAMTAFLDQPTLWLWAERYHHAGRLAHWKKLHNLARVDVAPDVEAACEALSAAIRDHFIHAEGRGRNCHVEHSRRGAKDYFFAFPRDHATQALEWVSDDMTRRPSRLSSPASVSRLTAPCASLTLMPTTPASGTKPDWGRRASSRATATSCGRRTICRMSATPAGVFAFRERRKYLAAGCWANPSATPNSS